MLKLVLLSLLLSLDSCGHKDVPIFHVLAPPFEVDRGGGGVLIINNGRSRMTIDPRIPTTPGRSTLVFIDQEDIASTKRGAP